MPFKNTSINKDEIACGNEPIKFKFDIKIYVNLSIIGGCFIYHRSIDQQSSLVVAAFVQSSIETHQSSIDHIDHQGGQK